jgi:hypothetical protein
MLTEKDWGDDGAAGPGNALPAHRQPGPAGGAGRRAAPPGLEASTFAPDGRFPRLTVRHPAGEAADVYAWRGQDGGWWFWWPWAERIAPGAEPERAAAAVERVLTSCPGG